MHWNFREQEPGEQTRDPIIGEFFSTDAIDNPAEALIREGIQNSLDAGSGGQVRIRIFLATDNRSLPSATWQNWMKGAWPHITAKRNGLREQPSLADSCPYLVFEDFGTTGLNGDIAQPFDEPDITNPFFYFFRAEGRSGKGDGDRGRWGVGKHVFPRASSICTFFGLSVRRDDNKKILMGRTVLKSHKINDKHYCPDGYLGTAVGKFTNPIVDVAIQEQFASDFNITRTDEPGLSIVVPFIDFEISCSHLARAVIEGYFWPIMKGQLVVQISSHDQVIELHSESLGKIAATLQLSEMASTLKLAEAAYTTPPSSIALLNPCDPTRPAWDDALVPPESSDSLRSQLASGEMIAVRAALSVRKKGGESQPSHFDVFLRQDGCEKGRPIFVREGIIISDARSPRTRGVRSIVVIDDKPIATLLGDSENPAHTQWQKDSSNFKGKYVYGPSYIEFVTKVVNNLILTLQSRDDEINKTILSDLFYLPPNSDDEDTTVRPDKSSKNDPGKESDDDKPDIEPSKKRFRLKRVDGGFSIVRGDTEVAPPALLDIRLAYDVRKGNPLKKYDPADFRVQSQPIQITHETAGVSCTTINDNHIVAEISSAAFVLTVVGFDKNRDLFIKVRMEENVDATAI